ncbi:unnamed protein product [Trichobilharzia regenti]|nr:unnamed protein product [Trichobilharzia regenti]
MLRSVSDFVLIAVVKIVGTYHPPMVERIVLGVRAGLEEMIRLGVVKSIAPLFEFLHRSSSTDLLRSLRVLLGLDPPSTLPNTVVSPVDSPNRILPEKWVGPGDMPTVNTNSSPVTSSTIVSRNQNTTPLPNSKPLSSVLTTDSGPPTDPRLTRGHAAIIAGVVPPSVSSVATENVIKPVLTASESPPILQTSVPMAQQQNPSLLIPSQDDVKAPIIPVRSTLPLLPTLPRSSQQLAEAQITDDDMDIMEIDILDSKPAPTRTATWSPPPIESRHVIKKSSDHEPDTPDSLEFKIDNLRRRFQDYQLRFHYFVESVDVNSLIKQLDGPIRAALEQFRDVAKHVVFLRSPSVLNDLCESMEGLIQAVLVEDSFDDLEIAGRTAAVVCELLFCLFAQRLMPIGVEWSEDKLNDEKMSIYRNFCASQENPNLRDSLFKDMQLLSDDNRRLFAYLLPDVFTVFSSELSDDTEFLQLIVATIDPGMCNSLISEIVRGHLNLFPNNDLTSILSK